VDTGSLIIKSVMDGLGVLSMFLLKTGGWALLGLVDVKVYFCVCTRKSHKRHSGLILRITLKD
jgi:hypothetical protein